MRVSLTLLGLHGSGPGAPHGLGQVCGEMTDDIAHAIKIMQPEIEIQRQKGGRDPKHSDFPRSRFKNGSQD
jgi:hypothetical protein